MLRYGAILIGGIAFLTLIDSASIDAANLSAQKVVGLPTEPYKYDPIKAALGEKIFFDKRLSADGKMSCATCHKPEKAFTDGLAVAVGVFQQAGTRNTPSLWNVAFQSTQFWDGRRPSLESQALDPLLNRREHGIKNIETVLGLLRNDSSYRNEFSHAFGLPRGEIASEHLAAALAEFQRTLTIGDSPFDLYFYGRQSQVISESAIRGLELFTGRAQCASCHRIEGTHALFTDNDFHNVGVRIGEKTGLAQSVIRVINSESHDIGEMIMNPDIAALGRFVVTRQPRDIGKFKTPSLRNVALTAPYMHDGSVLTLEEAVELEVYYRSIERNDPLILTPSEKADLGDFLRSLTSPGALRYVVPPTD